MVEALTLQSLEFTKKPGHEIRIFSGDFSSCICATTCSNAIHLITEPQGFASSAEGACAIPGWQSRQEEPFRKWHMIISAMASSYTYSCKTKPSLQPFVLKKEGDTSLRPSKAAEAGPGESALTPVCEVFWQISCALTQRREQLK